MFFLNYVTSLYVVLYRLQFYCHNFIKLFTFNYYIWYRKVYYVHFGFEILYNNN